jgi:WD40 repeat protein
LAGGWLGLFGMVGGGGGGGGGGLGLAGDPDTLAAAAILVLQASRALAAEATAAAAAHQQQPSYASSYTTPSPASANPAIAAALAGELPTRAGLGAAARSAAAAPSWRPRGVPLAHLAEHTRGVTALAVSRSGRFFVSASTDGTARVWDVAGLERDVSQRSRGVYGGSGSAAPPLTCATACVDGDTIATGCSDGSIHVWRASYARGGGASVGRPGTGPERVAGLDAVATRPSLPTEGAITALHDWGHLLLYSTLRGGVRAWDVRTDVRRGGQATAWALACDPREGSVGVVLGGGEEDGGAGPADAWLLSGTSRGIISIWDARLALRSSAWRLPGGARVVGAAAATAPRSRLGVRGGGAPAGPLVWIAAAGEVGLYDVGSPTPPPPRSIFRVVLDAAGAAARPALLSEPPAPPTPHPADLNATTATTPPPGIRALLSTPTGPLLTGSADGCVRLWDGAAPEESYIIAGDPSGMHGGGEGMTAATGAGPAPAPSSSSRARMYARRTVDGVPTVDDAPCAAMAPPPVAMRAGGGGASGSLIEPSSARALAHRDAVTALADVEGVGGVRLLLSAGRDGVVKAWR